MLQTFVYIMKFNPQMLLITLFVMTVFSPFQILGQKSFTTNKKAIDQLFQHDHRKCGTEEAADRLAKSNPAYAKELREFKEDIIPALSKIQSDRSVAPIINIPVVVHVIHNGEPVGTGANISDGQIQAQIDVLNLDFSAMNSNYNDTPAQWQGAIGNPEVQFCLAIIDPNGNPTNGITRDNIAVTGTSSNNNNIEDEIKPAVWWDSDEYYNIYVLGIPGTTSGGGVTGYAYYPTNGLIGTVLDGSVVDYRWFGGPGFSQSGYRTLTHETGHYLGLPHTFDGEDCGADDNIDDTPNIDAPTADYAPGLNCSPGNFPTGPSSCGNEHMYVNFMDYVNDDDCTTSFTNDQINVMRAVLDGTPPPPPFNYGSRLPLTQNATTVCSFFDNDAGISTVIEPTNNYCGTGQITPVVTLQNFGVNTLTTVTISYQINGGTPVDFIWVDNLPTGETQDVTLVPYIPPMGSYTFTVYTSLPNGVTDEQTSNDQQEVTVTTVTPTNIPLVESFEDAQWDPTVNGVFQFNVSGDSFEWERTTSASGFGTGVASAVFNNFDGTGGSNPGGTVDALITSVYDFSAVAGANLTFDVAYAPFDASFFDSLKIYASTDCGSTFDQLLFSDGNTGLATAPATTSLFTPTANQWTTHTIDLSVFDNTPNLTIAFLNISGWGNRLFIDNINISAGCSMTIAPLGVDAMCNGICNGSASVTISGGTAPYSYQWDANAGNSTAEVVQNLCEGSYSVTVTDATFCTAETIVTITEPSAISLDVISTPETSVGANDGTAIAIVSGGAGGPFTYIWDDPFNQVTSTATNLTPGQYCVTVTDANDCTASGCTVVEPFDCGNFVVNASSTDIDCNGNQNGTVNAVAENGTTPYSYVWSTMDMTAEVSGLGVGDYTVTATDDNGCTSETTVTINQPDLLLTAISSTDETSTNANDGTASANPSGGTLPYTYVWNDPGSQTAETAIDLSPGDYCVTVTDANDCSVESCTTVAAFDCGNFQVSLTPSDVTCFGFTNGSITSIVENGSTPYVYLWSNGEETSNIEDLSPGIYTLTVTDASGCTTVETTDVSEPDVLTVSVTCTDESSANANDGSCTVSVSGGTPGYIEQWSNGQGGTMINNLSPGTYCVTVTDSNGCTEESCGTVNGVNCNLSIDVITENITCFNDQDGAAEAITTGGTDPIIFLWSTGESTQSIQGLSPGSYTVTATDAQGCEVVQQFVITEPEELIVTIDFINPSSPGAADGSATAMPQGGTPGYIYAWDTGDNTQMITGLVAGIYTVTITDVNGCTVENEIVLEDPNLDCNDFTIEVDIVEITCNGFENGAFVAGASNGTLPYEYLWSNGVMTNVNIGIGAGVYSVTATDAAGCIISAEVELFEPPALVVTMSTTSESSAGAGDGMATANLSGGVMPYMYEWSNGGTTATISNLSSGMYSVTVTDANGCFVSESTFVGVEGVDCSNFEIADFQVISVSCFEGEDGVVTAIPSGGEAPITYEWSNGGTGQTIQGLQAGLYVVTATDVNGCMTLNEVVVTQPVSGINVDFGTTNESVPGAGDGAIDVTVSGGTPPYIFSWSNNATTEDIENLNTGIYMLTITDANGCIHETSIFVDVEEDDCSSFVLDSESQNISCNGEDDGFIVVTTSGGVIPITFEWSNGENTQSLFGLASGLYVLTVTDGNNCEIVEEFVITEPPVIEVNISSTNETILGDDGTATALGSGGTGSIIYEWSNGEMTPSIDNLAPGTYTLTITDELGCTQTEMVIIEEFTDFCGSFDATVQSTGVNCFGNNNGTAVAEGLGGLPPYQYNWSNGSNLAAIDNLSGGTYMVTITDENDCIIILSTTVTEPSELTLDLIPYNGNCGSTGIIDALVNGGTQIYEYNWSTGDTADFISGLNDGIYTVTVTDSNGCTVIGEATIENDEGGVEIDSEVNSVSCFGESDGEIDITTLSGTAPFSYNWNTGEITQDLQNLDAGTYTVLITDADNCSYLTTFVVSSPAELTANIEWTPANSGNNGTAIASASGGTSPYTYQWSNGSNSSSIGNLNTGNYVVTVTDVNGCEVITSVVIGTTAVNELPGLENLEISPNPSNGNFVLNAAFSTFKTGYVEVYNILGQQVFVSDFSNQLVILEIGLLNQPAGSYLLVIKTEEGRAVRKLIIQQ
jgi:pregnancy-associated plasma protein-A/SprB-like repeat protein/type IX secretion system substrate protein